MFLNDTATTEIYSLSLHDALPISARGLPAAKAQPQPQEGDPEKVSRALTGKGTRRVPPERPGGGPGRAGPVRPGGRRFPERPERPRGSREDLENQGGRGRSNRNQARHPRRTVMTGGGKLSSPAGLSKAGGRSEEHTSELQ